MDFSNNLVPMVVKQTGKSERAYDIYSMLQEPDIVFVWSNSG